MRALRRPLPCVRQAANEVLQAQVSVQKTHKVSITREKLEEARPCPHANRRRPRMPPAARAQPATTHGPHHCHARVRPTHAAGARDGRQQADQGARVRGDQGRPRAPEPTPCCCLRSLRFSLATELWRPVSPQAKFLADNFGVDAGDVDRAGGGGGGGGGAQQPALA